MQITVAVPHSLTKTRLPYNYLNVSFYSILTEGISFQDLLCVKKNYKHLQKYEWKEV